MSYQNEGFDKEIKIKAHLLNLQSKIVVGVYLASLYKIALLLQRY